MKSQILVQERDIAEQSEGQGFGLLSEQKIVALMNGLSGDER